MMNAEALEQNEDEILKLKPLLKWKRSRHPLCHSEDPAQQKRLIEALLFASPEPIKLRAIQARLPDSADVGTILLELQSDYAERGVQLVQLEDALWAFRTAADIGPQLALTKKKKNVCHVRHSKHYQSSRITNR